MNKIEKLIQQLCPDGVDYKQLGEIAEFRRGSFPQPYGKDEWYGGEGALPFVQVADVASNMKLVSKTKQTISVKAQSKSIFVPEGTVLVTLQGSIGRVAITQYDCYVDRTLAIFQGYRIDINVKYFAYQLESKFNIEKEFARGSTLKTITKEEFTKFTIPIPPLPIQQEIVTILDKFTQLEAELEAELEARSRQYEYYRNQLLSFEGKEVEWKMLGDVADLKAGRSISASKISSISNDKQKFICVGGNGIRGFVEHYSHEGNFPIIGRQGALCGNLFFASGKFYATEHAVVVKPLQNENKKFLYYLLKSLNLNQFATGGAQPGLAVTNLNKIKIPIPSLEEQERIVNILDQFDALVNDIKTGLPAEIKARRAQYEYYRKKLLTFQKT